MKFGIYGLSYNNEKEIEAWYESIKFANKIIVVDLGSTDNTVKLLQDKQIEVLFAQDNPLREEVIKNRCIEIFYKEYKDINLLLNLDVNEILLPSSIPYLLSIQNTANNKVKYCYSCQVLTNNRNYLETKIHSNDLNYFWKYPIRSSLKFKEYKDITSTEECLHNVLIEKHPLNISKNTYEELLTIRLLEDLEGKDIWGRIFLVELDLFSYINIRTLKGIMNHYNDITVDQYAYCWYLLGKSLEKSNPFKAIEYYKKCNNIIPEWKAPYDRLYNLYVNYGFNNLSKEIATIRDSQCNNLKLYIDEIIK